MLFCCFRYNEDLELEDAIHTAILTLKVKTSFDSLANKMASEQKMDVKRHGLWFAFALKCKDKYVTCCLPNVNVSQESFEGQMTEDNIEVGICNESGFRRLTPAEVKDYLAAIA